MITAEAAITRYQRDVVLSSVLRWLLLAAAIASVLVLPFVIKGFDATFGLALVLGIWLALSFTSAKNSRILGPSSDLIARGEFEEAETRIDQAMRAFTISRTSKLLGLHQLAVLRHKQRQWQDAATLSRAVLARPLTAMPGLDRSARLVCADSLLELGDAREAAESIAPLRGQPMALSDTLALLHVELDVQSRQGAWDAMLVGLPSKVQLAELMPPAMAGRTQALLALAAKKKDRLDWSDWLRRRVELLSDVSTLTTQRPALSELWERKTDV